MCICSLARAPNIVCCFGGVWQVRARVFFVLFRRCVLSFVLCASFVYFVIDRCRMPYHPYNVMLCIWGTISPQTMQKIMEMALMDFKCHADGALDLSEVEKLANLGSKGVHPNNVWRDFKNCLPEPNLPKPHVFLVPMAHPLLGLFTKPMSMLLPHELFAHIYTHFPNIWRDYIYHSAERCKLFWCSVKHSPHFLNHPVRFRENYTEKCIPLKLHGDGTPVTGIGKGWSKMMDLFSLSSLLAFGPTILRNYLIFAVHQALQTTAEGSHTLKVFFRKLAWSLYWAYLGKWPTEDWNKQPINSAKAGTDLMGGFFMTVWLLASDGDHNSKVYGLPNSNRLDPCGLCPVNSSTLPWYDFRINAEWVNRIYDQITWEASGWNTSNIFEIFGLGILSVYPDWMHVKHLGLDKVLLGSTLWVLLHMVLPGEDKKAKLQIIMKDILDLYKARNTSNRFGNIKLTMFTGNSSNLKGKAGEVKDLGPIMLEIWRRYMQPDRFTIHTDIELVLKLSCRLDEILDEHPTDFVLDDAAADELIGIGFACCALWAGISQHFKDENLPLFGLTSKAHLLLHCCLLSRHRLYKQ